MLPLTTRILPITVRSAWVAGVLMGMNGTNLTGTYGDQIYNYAAPVTNDSTTLEFAATAAATTQAGIYAGNELLNCNRYLLGPVWMSFKGKISNSSNNSIIRVLIVVSVIILGLLFFRQHTVMSYHCVAC